MSQTVSVPLRKLLTLALLGGLAGGLWGCSSTAAAPPVDGGVGIVSGALDEHCSGVEPIMTNPASCKVGADASAPADDGGASDDGGKPAAPIHFNAESDDDDCKYHVKFTTTSVLENQAVTLTVTVTKLAENNAPATGARPAIESFLAADELHPIPNFSGNPVESPANSGVYKMPPVKFDASGRWVVRFHFYESCFDILEDSQHGHVAFYFDVP